MNETRPLCIMETPYSTVAPCYIQLCIEVSDPSKISLYCQRILSYAIPFHLKVDVDKKLVHLDHHENKIFNLPDSIDNLEDAIHWSMEHAKPNETTQVGTLSASNKFIVYNANHAWVDGGQWINIVEAIQKDDFVTPALTLPPSVLSEITFKKQVEESEPKFISMLDKTKTLFNHDPKLFGKSYNFGRDEIPISSISGYNNGHIHQLTAMLVAAFTTAAKAYSGFENNDGFGVQAAINLRRYLSEPLKSSPSIGYMSGNIAIYCENPPTTMDELINELDKKCKQEIDERAFLGATRYLLLPLLHPEDKRYIPITSDGYGLYLSNVGRFRIKRPITNIMINVQQTVQTKSIVLFSYSVDSENGNILHNHLINEEFSSKSMQKFAKLINFALVNMKRESKISDFIDFLKQKLNEL